MMELIDELRKMKRKGRHVVSIQYVLDNLRSTENDYKPKAEQIPIDESKAI